MRAHDFLGGANFWCAPFGRETMEEREGFKVTLESLYTKKIKEISYDEEESYQE